MLAKLAPPSWSVPGVPFTAQVYQIAAACHNAFTAIAGDCGVAADLYGNRIGCPAGKAPALQIIFEALLRAFLESGGFITQMREDFAGEMK